LRGLMIRSQPSKRNLKRRDASDGALAGISFAPVRKARFWQIVLQKSKIAR
jgi:hypothetical protein